jgi:hypothetical protein
MSVSQNVLHLKSARSRFLGAAAVFLGLVSSACRSTSPTEIAPALGTFGGVAVGALIGSAGGNAGSGAAIGGMLGRSGGEIVRSTSPARAASDTILLRELPATLRSAARFDAALEKEHASLARRRATSPGPETTVVKAQAKQKLTEIKSWIDLLTECDNALARAISDATAYPSKDLGTWLNQRHQIRARLASLKTHQSWFKTLAS